MTAVAEVQLTTMIYISGPALWRVFCTVTMLMVERGASRFAALSAGAIMTPMRDGNALNVIRPVVF